MKSFLPVMMFVVASTVAAAAQTAAAPVSLTPESKTVTSQAPNAGDKIVCIQGDAPTGSRLGSRKTCHTAAQWTQIHDASLETIGDFQMRGETADATRYNNH